MAIIKIALGGMLALIAGLAIASAVLLTAANHDASLHHTYSCDFAKDFAHEIRVPTAPCHK